MPEIVEAVIRSTERYLELLTEQGRGVELHGAQRREGKQAEPCYVHGRLHHKYLFRTVPNLSLQSDDRVIYITRESGDRLEAKIVKYDRRSGAVDLAFLQETATHEGNIEIDFKWLVRRTLEWYRDHGSKIDRPPWHSAPKNPRIIGDDRFGTATLSEEQRQAVSSCLSHGFTYAWGPPGTGKTQFALSSVVREIAKGGQRVLVVAPTNNAVDNAIRAVLRISERELARKHVIRLGIPTPEFMQENTDVCEDAEVREKLAQLSDEIKAHNEQLTQLSELQSIQTSIAQGELRIETITAEARTHWDQAQALEVSISECTSEMSRVESRLAELAVAEARAQRDKSNLPALAHLFPTAARREIELRLAELALETATRRSELGQRRQAHVADNAEKQRHELEMKRLAEQRKLEKAKLSEMIARREILVGADFIANTSDVDEVIAKIQDELKELESRRSRLELNLAEKKVIGLTLDGFIGRSADVGFNVDYVLVDEAAYAPLAKLLPLLSLKRPIALFGDHRQLPPICESDGNDTKSRAYWGKSALFLETAWESPMNFSNLAAQAQPNFNVLRLARLTKSYRFDDRLASILQRRVYPVIPLTGVATEPTEVFLLDVSQNLDPHRKRVNLAEVDAVCELVASLAAEGHQSMAVLTPYKNQASAIRAALRQRRLLATSEVLNTHRAQGREWDVVVFSAVDGAQYPGPFFTDSNNDDGVLVLNTTISRVRRKLYLVADGGYWGGRQNQLIGDLVAIAQRLDVNSTGTLHL